MSDESDDGGERTPPVPEGGPVPTAGSLGGLGDLFSQLESARAELESTEEAIEATVVEGSAANGAVVVRLSGALGAESVRIDPGIVDPNDVELLEDAVLAALRDALDQVAALRSDALARIDPQLGGADLGQLVGNLDLEGLLGGVDLDALLGGGDLGQLMGNLGLGGPTGEAPGGGDDEPEA